MWRFKPSKFKNATPKVPKKEGWFLDISVGTQHSHGNHIEASAAFMAFNIESGVGGSIGILSLEDVGRKSKNLPVLHAHSDLVTDFDFCPYDDGILASGSQDHHVKIWRIPEEGIVTNFPCNPEVDLVLDNRVEVVCFHPVADCILTTSDGKCIRLWDISTKHQIFSDSSHEDLIQSFSWKSDGQLLASCGRDKKLNILDPRDSSKAQITSSHSNNRDSRVIWLGESDQVLTTGFGSGREREVLLRDVRNFGEPLATYSGDSALGVLIPLFDPDTNMLFLVGKADTAVSYWEIVDKMPFFSEASRYFGDVQIRGACLVPKRALHVMEGEVNRILLLGPDCIVPITYQVPRKTYRDFHPDLFPDTRAAEPALTLPQWQSQETCKINKISLDPSKSSQKTLLKFNHKLGSGPSKVFNVDLQDNNNASQAINQKKQINSAPSVLVASNNKEEIHNSSKLMRKEEKSVNQPKPATPQKPVLFPKPQASQINENLNGFREPSPVLKVKNLTPPSSLSSTSPSSPEDKLNSQGDTQQPRLSPSPRRPARTFGIRVSKFRHLNGTVMPKETHITDISTLTRTIPGESDGFHANSEHIAVPLGVAGGLIAVLKLSSTGRSPSLADVPGVVCGTSVMDFSWDPFDLYRLVTVCDTGEIQVWNINPGGIFEKVTEPSFTLKGHTEKTNIVKFHPLARDVICTASSDLSIRIWDLAVMEEKYCLLGHTDQIFSVAWNPNGQYLATVCKDQKIRLYDPRNSCLPIREGPGPQGSRGARILWVLGGAFLVVSGFSKVSERQIYLYDVKDLSTPIGTAGIDVSPAILIPHYDEDSSTLFLTGKGDSTIFAYEVATDAPYFHPLSHYKCSGPHQALSFLPKYVCNIEDVEFARAIRLTTSTIEPVSFTVPRLRAEFFQDDLFPDTRITWEPTCTSEEWFTGLDQPSKFISLRPDGMTPVSQAPTPTKTPSSNQNATNTPSEIVFEGEIVLEGSLAFLQNSKEKEEMIVQSMMSQCQLQTSSLPQDSFEGVDPKEWDEEEDSH